MNKNNSLSQKLERYKSVSKGYYQNEGFSSLEKGLLVASLPLLSVGAAMAQCQGTIVTNFSVPETGEAAGVLIDVDGDNISDFVIFDPAFTCCGGGNLSLLLKPLGTARAFTAGGSGTVVKFGAGAAINGGNTGTYGGAQWLAFSYMGSYGNFGRPYPNSGYIGFTKGGKFGFIELVVSSGPTSSGQSSGFPFVISIPEAGLQNANQSVIAGNCATLPVELSRFNAKTKDNSAILTWETNSEQNNAGFELLRSTDGRQFTSIGFVEGEGTSHDVHRYQYIDKDLRSNTLYYYKLKQVDFNGQFEFSEVLSLEVNGAKEVVGDPYPNPAKHGEVFIDINMDERQPWKVQILDLNGRLLSETRYEEINNSRLKIDLPNTLSGTYMLRVVNNDKSFYRKLVVQH